MHEPSWYNKEQLTSLTSTQLVLFNEVHIQQVSGPPVIIKLIEYNIWFPRYEEGNVGVKTGKYETKINRKSPPLSMNKREDSTLV